MSRIDALNAEAKMHVAIEEIYSTLKDYMIDLSEEIEDLFSSEDYEETVKDFIALIEEALTNIDENAEEVEKRHANLICTNVEQIVCSLQASVHTEFGKVIEELKSRIGES